MELFPDSKGVGERRSEVGQHDDDARGVELQLQALERDATKLLDAANQLSSILKKLRTSSKIGELKKIAKCLEEIRSFGPPLQRYLKDTISFDLARLRQSFNSDKYLTEIEEHAAVLGITGMRNTNGMLLVMPHRLSRVGEGVKIGKQIVKGIRPSSLASLLKKIRSRNTAEKNDRSEFLHRLEKAYLLLGNDRQTDTERLDNVYALLTLLPEARKLYSIDDFIADIHDLDSNGPYVTLRKREVSFPASTSTRGSKGFPIVDAKGETKLYVGLRFSDQRG